MGDAHIGQLVIREWRISSNEKLLARFELIEKYFYGIFDMRYCLHLILVFSSGLRAWFGHPECRASL